MSTRNHNSQPLVDKKTGSFKVSQVQGNSQPKAAKKNYDIKKCIVWIHIYGIDQDESFFNLIYKSFNSKIDTYVESKCSLLLTRAQEIYKYSTLGEYFNQSTDSKIITYSLPQLTDNINYL